MKSLRSDGLGLAFVLIWSSGYVVGALATQVIAPLAVTLWRFVLATAILTVVAVIRRERWPRGRQLALVAAIGLPMFAIQFGALYTALADGMPASTTALIACSSPLLVAALGAAARWERLTALQWSGIALGVVGVVVTLADRVARPPSLVVLTWALLGLAGLAAGTVLQSRVKTTAGPSAIAAIELGMGAVVLAVWAPLRGPVAIALTFHALGTFLWLAIVTGVGAPLLLFALIRQRGATRASSFLFVVPAVTAIAAWPILGTPIGALTFAGLVVVGIALRLVRPRPDRATPSDQSVSTTAASSSTALPSTVTSSVSAGFGTRSAGSTSSAITAATTINTAITAKART
jgi:drug/metabolite transporter (DMT)-like permease